MLKHSLQKLCGHRLIFNRLFSEKRGEYAVLNYQDVQHFEQLIGKSNVLTEDLDPYNVDFMKWYKGKSQCVLTPESADQVSAIIRHCYQRKLAIVPQAGNTGLVGGSVPVHDEIILSVRKIKKHFKLHEEAGILECDAGFTLHELDERLEPHNYIMPIDLGARGSCCIGGNIATNAGGIRLIRYGSLVANVLALQVVIPDDKGSIFNLGTNLRKDNSDVRQLPLFIGSEGQFGIITRASILVAPKPISTNLAFLGTDSFENCVEILRAARRFLENVNMDNVLKSSPPFNLLIESSGFNVDHDLEKMAAFVDYCVPQDSDKRDGKPATEGISPTNETEVAYLWKLRENASLALNFDGYVYKHDLSLPLPYFYKLTEAVRERLKGTNTKRIVTFGHVGDGNTHLNITSEKYDQEISDKLYPFIYEWVCERGGSISAEHGIGRLKRVYHHKLVPKVQQELNSKIKRSYDPHLILSPYKMID
ncbi:D-2-hydroxyglutarate dehydrogenase, mitochondrial [Aphelenchoides bicaudatus]|nr:D-2-hydroxyglutarate dehydrogenase, mitochondrial [Aphelenchoides bicaudatus]